MGTDGQRHGPAALLLGKRPSTHCTGDWVGPRTGLRVQNLAHTGIRFPDRPARRESLYRLRYPAQMEGFILRNMHFYEVLNSQGARGGVVVKALRYKPAGRGFDSRWCHSDFSGT
jgi:hypothetical protein